MGWKFPNHKFIDYDKTNWKNERMLFAKKVSEIPLNKNLDLFIKL